MILILLKKLFHLSLLSKISKHLLMLIGKVDNMSRRKKRKQICGKRKLEKMINHKVTDVVANGMTNFGSYSPFTHSLKRLDWNTHRSLV